MAPAVGIMPNTRSQFLIATDSELNSFTHASLGGDWYKKDEELKMKYIQDHDYAHLEVNGSIVLSLYTGKPILSPHARLFVSDMFYTPASGQIKNFKLSNG